MIYTLSMFNTGQVTLPKKWREKFKTSKFVAEEVDGGLFIRPIESDETVFYQDKDGFGIYCDNGLDIAKIKATIKKIHG